ncbi:hypothetical protein ANCCAN_17722 [Ancylostoma caninum]|uniref:Uncharacterized protein n=1 Tax=Ancylostoma caninum TaxID=29170 RepID=A0A368FW40_ANCCA|nr:hypothetical protein ANCCAN_17722 [Ancylostoma caninum]
MDRTGWLNVVQVLCVIAALVFIVATIMLALYIIRLMCHMAVETPISDLESGDVSESIRSRRSRRSRRSSRRSRRGEHRSRGSRSRSLSLSERETPPRTARALQEGEERVLNLVVKTEKPPSSTGDQKAAPGSDAQKQPPAIPVGIPVESDLPKIKPYREQEEPAPPKAKPVGIPVESDLPKIKPLGKPVESDHPKGVPVGIPVESDLPKIKPYDPNDDRADAAGNRSSAPGSSMALDNRPQGLVINVEPGTSISVNVRSSYRAHAGRSQDDWELTSESSSESDTIHDSILTTKKRIIQMEELWCHRFPSAILSK